MRSLALALLVALVSGCAPDPDTPAFDTSQPDPDAGGLADAGEMDAEAIGEESGFTADYAGATLDGAWRSTIDSSVVVAFRAGEFEERYDGEVMLRGPVAYTETCDGSEGGGDLDTFSFTIDAGEHDPICYDVVETDGESLAYMMHGGRGNLLTFERAE